MTQEQRQQAEEHLVGLAAEYDAKALALLGHHLFEVVAPDLAERFDGKALEAEEATALRRTFLELREDGEGTCHGKFRVPALHGQILRKFILALDSPARPTHAGRDHELSTPVRHGLAFCQLLEAIPGKSLPKAGSCSATIVVTMTLEQLLAGLDAAGVCTLDTGGPDQCGRGQASRLHRRNHPCGARRQERSPRRRPQEPLPPRAPADRDDHPRRRLH